MKPTHRVHGIIQGNDNWSPNSEVFLILLRGYWVLLIENRFFSSYTGLRANEVVCTCPDIHGTFSFR